MADGQTAHWTTDMRSLVIKALSATESMNLKEHFSRALESGGTGVGDYTRPEEQRGAVEMYDHPNYKFFSQRTFFFFLFLFGRPPHGIYSYL